MHGGVTPFGSFTRTRRSSSPRLVVTITDTTRDGQTGQGEPDQITRWHSLQSARKLPGSARMVAARQVSRDRLRHRLNVAASLARRRRTRRPEVGRPHDPVMRRRTRVPLRPRGALAVEGPGEVAVGADGIGHGQPPDTRRARGHLPPGSCEIGHHPSGWGNGHRPEGRLLSGSRHFPTGQPLTSEAADDDDGAGRKDNPRGCCGAEHFRAASLDRIGPASAVVLAATSSERARSNRSISRTSEGWANYRVGPSAPVSQRAI